MVRFSITGLGIAGANGYKRLFCPSQHFSSIGMTSGRQTAFLDTICSDILCQLNAFIYFIPKWPPF